MGHVSSAAVAVCCGGEGVWLGGGLSRGCPAQGVSAPGCGGVLLGGVSCLGGMSARPPRETESQTGAVVMKLSNSSVSGLQIEEKPQLADEMIQLDVLHYVQRVLNKGSLTSNPLIHILH